MCHSLARQIKTAFLENTLVRLVNYGPNQASTSRKREASKLHTISISGFVGFSRITSSLYRETHYFFTSNHYLMDDFFLWCLFS